jgi:hypothetical protein
VTQSNPNLILNVDETTLDSKKDFDKIKVVSTRKCPWSYWSVRGESHITFMPTVAITRWFLPTLIIIKFITVISNLAIQYDFPISNWGHILTFSSVYINKEIFKYWITKILVPGVQMRKKAFGLANDTWCLLILDRCLAHNEEYMKELNKHFIDYHFLVSHSSYLSQLLDRGIFVLFKWEFKNTQCNDTQNKVKRRLIRGLIVLHQVCSPAHIRSSFWRAGFEMNYIDGIPTINI